MNEHDFIPPLYTADSNKGSFTWKAPSNIALVKYWGKHEHQIPANPSVSFTLKTCTTRTTLSYEKRIGKTDDFSFELFFDGTSKPDFRPKILKFFERIVSYLPFLTHYHFTIDSSNSFPHSSGIASSASSMSALALCLVDLERKLHPEMTADFFYRKASFIARLGSGSASRSIEGSLVTWGAHKEVAGSSDLYGIPYPYHVHRVFNDYQDTILLVDQSRKEISSSTGHRLMHGHIFAEQRFKQAQQHMTALKTIFAEGDVNRFIAIVEHEALTLHAMMMTSFPYFILMKPNTLCIIRAVWEFRVKTKLNLCFTLDAGANVHLLYPEHEKAEILAFINNDLVAYCENGQYICDTVGFGAEKL